MNGAAEPRARRISFLVLLKRLCENASVSGCEFLGMGERVLPGAFLGDVAKVEARLGIAGRALGQGGQEGWEAQKVKNAAQVVG